MSMWTLLLWLGLRASTALAGSPIPPDPSAGGGGIQIQNPLVCGDEWGACINWFLRGLVILAAPVAGIMILVGGFQIMFAAGNEEKISKGKKTIVYTAVGYAIILLATGVSAVIQDALTIN